VDGWLLSLNVGKGKCKNAAKIDFSNKYKISDNVIEQVEQIKDLGVVFDSKLKFDEHIQCKNKRFRSAIAKIRSCRTVCAN